MNDREVSILNRIVGFGVSNVIISEGTQDGYKGEVVTIDLTKDDEQKDFFFPDYAEMSDADKAEVIANNLREELWNSVKQSQG